MLNFSRDVSAWTLFEISVLCFTPIASYSIVKTVLAALGLYDILIILVYNNNNKIRIIIYVMHSILSNSSLTLAVAVCGACLLLSFMILTYERIGRSDQWRH